MQVECTPEECAKRWKQLREKYVREKKKTEGKSGDAGPEIVSCWPLYQLMDFLRETVRHKRLVYVYGCIQGFKSVFVPCAVP